MSGPNECIVPLSGGQGCSLQAVWGFGNELFTYVTHIQHHKSNSTGSQLSATDCHSQGIVNLRWSHDMEDATTRKLINESHGVFVMLQGQAASLTGTALFKYVKEASRRYRSIIKACSLELQLMLSNATDAKRRSYKEQMELLETMMVVWHLVEILFIDTVPGEMILVQLLGWVRWHFSVGRELAQDVVNDDSPESHPAYWEAVYRLLLQGDIERVRKLISLHPCCQTSPFVSTDDLLRRMPQWDGLCHVAPAEFDFKWRRWQEECIRRYDDGQFGAVSQLEKIVQILCGDTLVFSEMIDVCETWYHMLISRLLFQNPTICSTDLCHHVQGCMDEFQRAGHHTGNLDKILQAALEFDLHQVIKDSSTYLGDRSWWFSAHLTDILHHNRQIDPQTLPYGSNLREYLMLEYVSGLMSHNSLWQVGIDYLDHCPVFGRQYAMLYVEKMPISTERKADKLIHICEEREFTDQMRGICKVMAERCSQKGRLGSALSWILRSKDVAVATRLTEKFLREYKEIGSFSYLDMLDHLGPTMLLNQQLTFLGKYREFHHKYQDGDLKGASTLLLNLLTARAAPRHFWVTLLLDALPLLETPQVVLGSEQTYELLHCLEELTQEMARHPEATPPLHEAYGPARQETLSPNDKDKLKYLRLALCRNLSRSIVDEGTVVLT